MGKIQGGGPVDGTTYYSYFISSVPTSVPTWRESIAFDFTFYGRTYCYFSGSNTYMPSYSYTSASYTYLACGGTTSDYIYLASNSSSLPSSTPSNSNYICEIVSRLDTWYFYGSGYNYSYIIKWKYDSSRTDSALLFQNWLLDNAVYTSTTPCYIDTSITFGTSTAVDYYKRGNTVDSDYGNSDYYSIQYLSSTEIFKSLNSVQYDYSDSLSVPASVLNQSTSDLLTYARLLGTFTSYTTGILLSSGNYSALEITGGTPKTGAESLINFYSNNQKFVKMTIIEDESEGKILTYYQSDGTYVQAWSTASGWTVNLDTIHIMNATLVSEDLYNSIEYLYERTGNIVYKSFTYNGKTISTINNKSLYHIIIGDDTYDPLLQLADVTDLKVEGTTASFTPAENATEYEFFVDDVSIGTYNV